MQETIFAVPSESLLVLEEDKAKEILEQIKNTPPLTKEEKEVRRKKVKTLFTKPGDTNETLLY